MTGESVEQAALRRARFEDRTLAILERCVTAVESLDRLDDKRAQEIADLNDGLLALNNRIENVSRSYLSLADSVNLMAEQMGVDT